MNNIVLAIGKLHIKLKLGSVFANIKLTLTSDASWKPYHHNCTKQHIIHAM